jgi:hypothetical protein
MDKTGFCAAADRRRLASMIGVGGSLRMMKVQGSLNDSAPWLSRATTLYV